MFTNQRKSYQTPSAGRTRENRRTSPRHASCPFVYPAEGVLYPVEE